MMKFEMWDETYGLVKLVIEDEHISIDTNLETGKIELKPFSYPEIKKLRDACNELLCDDFLKEA